MFHSDALVYQHLQKTENRIILEKKTGGKNMGYTIRQKYGLYGQSFNLFEHVTNTVIHEFEKMKSCMLSFPALPSENEFWGIERSRGLFVACKSR